MSCSQDHIDAFIPTLRMSLLNSRKIASSCVKLAIICLLLMVSSQRAASAGAVSAATSGEEADAQEPETAPARALPAGSSSLLLLGVFVAEKQDKGLRDAVVDRLMRLGEELRVAPESAEVLACKQAACYSDLSSRSAAARLLRFDIYENAARRYFVEGALYDAAKGAARVSSATCEDCSSENLRAILADLAARLLAQDPAVPRPVSKPVPPPPVPIPKPVIPIVPVLVAAPIARWTGARIALVTVLSALTGATLVGTIALGGLSTKYGDPLFCAVDRSSHPTAYPSCVGSNAVVITGIVLTGLASGGLAISLQQILRQDQPERR